MNNLISIGPPTMGVPDMRVPKKNSQSEESDSFKGVLEEKAQQQGLKGDSTQKQLQTRVAKTKEESDPRVRENREPARADKAEEKIPNYQGKPQKLTRERLIQNFMDSFESEIGIPSARLVEAMSSLKPEELQKSPEVTVDSVIDKLDLSDSDADKAKEMYIGLLLGLQKLDQQQIPKPTPMMDTLSPTSMGTNFQQRVDAGKNQLAQIHQSVDQLNQRFWSNPSKNAALNATKVPIESAQVSPGILEKMVFAEENPVHQQAMQTEDLNLVDDIPMKVPQDVVPKAMEQNPFRQQALDANQLQQVIPQSTAVEIPAHVQGQLRDQLSLKAKALKASAHAHGIKDNTEIDMMDSSNRAEATSQQVVDTEMDSDLNSFQQQQSEKQQKATSLDNQGVKKQVLDIDKLQREFFMQKPAATKLLSREMTLDKVKSLGNEDMLSSLVGQSQPLPKADALTPMAAAAMTSPNASPVDHEANVQKILNQAQYLVNKGGGEVKVQMNPEGLGQVHLKVMLNEGKVSVQVQAATPEAKKIIESSLSDLKTSLAAQKLSVENVKVDVVNHTSTDTAAQNNLNNGQGQQGFDQGNARQFWNQFHDQFGSGLNRQAYLDLSNPKGTGAKKQPLESIEAASATERRRNLEGKGSSLNLVA